MMRDMLEELARSASAVFGETIDRLANMAATLDYAPRPISCRSARVLERCELDSLAATARTVGRSC